MRNWDKTFKFIYPAHQVKLLFKFGGGGILDMADKIIASNAPVYTTYSQGGELLEVVNKNGVSTGRPATRKEVHEKGLWHRAIIVAIINDDNKILIQKRASTKEKFPGLWDLSVAGHIPFGADSMSCATVEVMEDVGYILPKKTQVRDFKFMSSFRNQLPLSDTFIENQFYYFFIYNLDIPIEEFHSQPEEVSEVRYATIFEIKEMAKQGLFHPRTEWIDVLYRYISKF